MNKSSNKLQQKREREKETVSKMIEIYCRKNHRTQAGSDAREAAVTPANSGMPAGIEVKAGIKVQAGRRRFCSECATLDEYTRMRSDKCPFMESKTFCSNCKVHCYRDDMREKIREVMRFSGPRMILYHPVMAVRHVVETKKEKKSLG